MKVSILHLLQRLFASLNIGDSVSISFKSEGVVHKANKISNLLNKNFILFLFYLILNLIKFIILKPVCYVIMLLKNHDEHFWDEN